MFGTSKLACSDCKHNGLKSYLSNVWTSIWSTTDTTRHHFGIALHSGLAMPLPVLFATIVRVGEKCEPWEWRKAREWSWSQRGVQNRLFWSFPKKWLLSHYYFQKFPVGHFSPTKGMRETPSSLALEEIQSRKLSIYLYAIHLSMTTARGLSVSLLPYWWQWLLFFEHSIALNIYSKQ